jgi:hypothetical protein
MAPPQHLPKQPVGGVGLTAGPQHELPGGTCGIHRPVEVVPRLADLEVRFIHTRRIVGGLQVGSAPLLRCWHITLDPAKHRRLVHR